MENTMSLRFDKLRFVKSLTESGQTQEQAEALATALDNALEQSQSTLATKNDLDRLELRLTEAMYKMAGFIIVGVGAMLGIFKFFS